METVEKTMQREGKKAKSGDKEAIALMAVLDKVLPCLNEAKAVRTLGLDAEAIATAKTAVPNYRKTCDVFSQCGRKRF